MDDHLEESIRLAIERGGRANGVDLLDMAAQILAGKIPPSPALAAWFRVAVDAIGNGESADVALGTKRKQGPDTLASRAANMERDTRILDLVAAARRDGFPTSPNAEKESCFEVVADLMSLPEKTVRTVYYEWETIESFTWPMPE